MEGGSIRSVLTSKLPLSTAEQSQKTLEETYFEAFIQGARVCGGGRDGGQARPLSDTSFDLIESMARAYWRNSAVSDVTSRIRNASIFEKVRLAYHRDEFDKMIDDSLAQTYSQSIGEIKERNIPLLVGCGEAKING